MADLFAERASSYARFRPRYPESFIGLIVRLTHERGLAWDVGTGSGQAAVALAPHFERVHATDLSQPQLNQAPQVANVTYHCAPAEASGLPSRTVDLVTVAQAAHWFDLPAFYTEVRRVAKRGCIMAIWCYGSVQLPDPLQRIVTALYEDTLGPYWHPSRRLIEGGYADLFFPFREKNVPAMRMTHNFSQESLLGYLDSWSAVSSYRADQGHDPLVAVAEALGQAWPEGVTEVEARFPLHLRITRL